MNKMEAAQVSDSERVFDFDVSVVIVNWKTPKLLARCLDSLGVVTLRV